MKSVSTYLVDFLQSLQPFARYDLILVTFPNGSSIPVTTCPTPINWTPRNSDTEYLAHPTKYGTWERGTITMEADYKPVANETPLTASFETNLNIMFPNTSTSFMQAVMAGVCDAALVQIETFYVPLANPNNYPPMKQAQVALDYYGTVYMLLGTITEMKQAGRSKIEFTVTDQNFLLNLPFPNNTVTSSCFWQLYDKRCTLSASNYLCSNSVTSGSNNLYIVCDSDPSITVNDYTFSGLNGDFNYGYLTFTSGQNTGWTYYINNTLESGDPAVPVFKLSRQTYFPVAEDDEFNCFPGCDKTITRCTQFANLVNIGSFPFVPQPEFAV